MSNTCYMCSEKATSIEHVPPKCLFPKSKDNSGKKDYRYNLITVPSCDLHNGGKSKDDEFLMVSLAGIFGNNSIGYEYYNGKIERALKRNSYRLLDRVFLKRKVVRIEKDNKFINFILGTPDYQRLIECFKHIALGLYRYHFNKNFIGTLHPHLAFLNSTESNPKTFKKFVEHLATDELKNLDKFGSNPDVFFYQITPPDKFGIFMMRLCFYTNADIYVSFKSNLAAEPFDLGMALINSGIKTTIKHGGKSYEFN
ncbi:MAG: hypothetical protein ACPGUG_16480 [Pseudoalteromonas marina]